MYGFIRSGGAPANPCGDSPHLFCANFLDLRPIFADNSYMPKLEYKNQMSDGMLVKVAGRFAALSDELRLRMLLRLKTGEASVNELSVELGVAQPSVSKHLAVLRQVGLVDVRRQGTSAIYFVKDRSIFDLCSLVCDGVARFATEQHQALGLDLPRRK